METADLVIVHPGSARGVYGALAAEMTAIEPPMWARLIAGYVRDRGCSVKIIDAEALRLSPHHVAELVRMAKPRLVCIAAYGHQPSASTQTMPAARETAKAIRRQWQGAEIIIVGGHVSALPERTLREEPVDFACVGEGPTTVLGLLNGNDKRDIPGLVWSDGLSACINPSAALLSVKDLHGQAWDLLPMTQYRAHNWQVFGDFSRRQPYASVYTSLGCPFKCSFCCINAPFESNRYRMRDPDDVAEEMAMLYWDHGVKTFKIVDEMYVLNERHYTAIAENLITHGLSKDINVWAYARVDTVKPDKLALLRRAGFQWLALGIESGSKHVRDGADKAFRNEDIAGVVRAIQGAGINVLGNYIFGLPDDDAESMRQTMALAVELNTEFANFYSAMAYPGSKLYTESVARGATLPLNWSGYSQHSDDCRPLDTEHVTAAEVLIFRDEAFRDYFQRQEYRDMVLERFGLAALEHVIRMTDYALPRKLLNTAA